jgi:cobalt-zinc-cadmium efflux system membrane fusion protein
MASFKPGLKLKLYTKAYPDRTFTGMIDYVGSGLDPATRTLRMRASVDNRDKLLKAEMYVTAEVDLGEGDRVAGGVDIPARAVFLQDNEPAVFVETGPGSFTRRQVRVGREFDEKVLAMSGVRPGERIVTEGCLLLQSMTRSRE